MDASGNLYFTHLIADLDSFKVFCLAKNQELLKTEEVFQGFLIEKDGEVFALERSPVELLGGEDYRIFGGQSSYYKVEKNSLLKVADFPYHYAPDDIIWIDGACYIMSSSWRLLEEFRVEQDEFVYVKTLIPQLDTPHYGEPRKYSTTTDGNKIYLAEVSRGHIYVIQP